MIDKRCFIRRGLVAMGVLALFASGAVGSKAADKADEAAAKQNARPSPDIIIADNVLMWDNRIVTWDQILVEFRTLRRGGPFHPTFHFTSGINHRKDGNSSQIWQNRIMEVYKELFEPAGVSFSNLSPRGSEKFDAVKTADDLRPDPARAHAGRLLTPEGKPAEGAQVVVLPTKAVLGVALKGTQLRDPFDELWALTDEQGLFTVYPSEAEYLIAALHPSGFVIQRGPPKGDPLSLRLATWATVEVASTGDVAGQSLDLTIRPPGTDPDSPNFYIYSIKTKGKALDIKVPAGKINVQRSLDMGQGTSIGLPAEAFTLEAGQRRTVELTPPSDADRSRAEEIHNLLHNRRTDN